MPCVVTRSVQHALGEVDGFYSAMVLSEKETKIKLIIISTSDAVTHRTHAQTTQLTYTDN